MEALIAKLFILSAEASIVLFLILIIILILKNKARRKDIHASREMVNHYVNRSDERISMLKKQLNDISFNGDADEQAGKLYEHEKSLIKEFVSLYLQHDASRLLSYAKNISEVDDIFLNISGASDDAKQTEILHDISAENANATHLAREQMESNDEQLKELAELRLKNTELNEHLFEALETITELMTEHGKKTGVEIHSNTQKLLEAIIYLRDKRLGKEQDSSNIAASTDNQNIEEIPKLDNSKLIDIAHTSEPDMNTPLESIETEKTAEGSSQRKDSLSAQVEQEAQLNSETEMMMTTDNTEEETQHNDEADTTAPEDNNMDDDTLWAKVFSEHAVDEADELTMKEEETDPWAEALAEQAVAEAEEDPWADALAQQNDAENKI